MASLLLDMVIHDVQRFVQIVGFMLLKVPPGLHGSSSMAGRTGNM